jgi:predicted transcriptional regulator
MSVQVVLDSLQILDVSDFSQSVYLLLVEHPEYTISEIARQIQSERRKIYQSLEELSRVGLVNLGYKKSDFVVLPLPTLTYLLRQKHSSNQRTYQDLTESIPKLLKSLAQNTDNSITKVYKTRAEFLRLFDLILDEADGKIWHFGSNFQIVSIMGDEYADHWVKRRAQKRISTREIDEVNYFIAQRRSKDVSELRETKWLPENMKVDGSYIIFGSKIALWSFSQLQIVVIEDRGIAELLKANFELTWSLLG